MSARPLVGVYSIDGKKGETVSHVTLPAVMTAPIRLDIVHDVHTLMAKNKRQPYAVSKYAGHQTSAESWGTGRAVARIPRVAGGGTHRAGQGAFGNMCRGGRMFAPTKVWRKWHKKINVNQKRYAVASALAASALPALVMSRGHRIEQISEVPLVVDNKSIDNLEKTSKAVALLKSLNAFADVQKSKDSTQLRRGKGKMRNRRYTQRRGPLVVYNEKSPLTRAFRNLPGIQLVSVTRLNLLDLAPGGHLGRFIIWTKDAFQRLDSLYGTYKKPSAEKLEYRLPKPLLTNADVSRVINSDEVQGALRPKQAPSKVFRRKYNPLNNMGSLVRLNPYASVLRRRRILAQEKQNQTRIALVEAKRKGEQQQKGGAPKKVSPKEAKIKKSKVADRKLKKQFYQTLLS
jgi:large subunit ribosomal protein L4e